MPSSGYRCTFELNLDIVSSPGTHLPNRDLLYVAIEVFGQAKRTRLLEAAFPLCVHERFRFERLFWSARDAREVVDLLADAVISVELRQVTDVYLGGCLLAHHETDAREFFQPMALGAFRSGERVVTLTRTVDFPGPAPRLEFTTSATIEELPGSSSGGQGSLGQLLDEDGNLRRSRPRSRPQPPTPKPEANGHERQTVSAVLRKSKSPAPPPAEPPSPSSTGRPPFVVRRIDDSLVSRKPGLHDSFSLELPTRRSRSAVDLERDTAATAPSSSALAPAMANGGKLAATSRGDGVSAVGSSRRRARSPSPSGAKSLARRYPSLTALPDAPKPPPPPPLPYRSRYDPYYYYYDPYYYYYDPYYYPYYYPYYSRYRYPYFYLDDIDLLEFDLRQSRLRRLYL